MNINKHSGFTLVELVMVMAIIGVLLAVGIPQYSDYMERSRRADGTSTLLDYAAEQEKWFFSRNTYTNTRGNLGPANSPEGFYAMTLDNNVGGLTCRGATPFNCFEIFATAQGRQGGDEDCALFSIDHTGAKKAWDTGGSRNDDVCW